MLVSEASFKILSSVAPAIAPRIIPDPLDIVLFLLPNSDPITPPSKTPTPEEGYFFPFLTELNEYTLRSMMKS